MAVIRVGVFGQNIAERLLSPDYTGILQTELRRSGNSIATTSYVSANSSLMKVNAREDVSNNHWWNEIDDVAGPALTQALNFIAIERIKPTIIMFDPGTIDATQEDFDITAYYSALVKVVESLQAACNPESFSSVKVILLHPSRHNGVNDAGQLRLLRRAQYIPLTMLNWVPLDCYDLPAIKDMPLFTNDETNSVLTPLSVTRLSYRLAHAVLYVSDISSFKQPKMDITRLDLSNIAVQINDNVRPLLMSVNYNSELRDIPHLTILRPGGFVPYPHDWIRFDWQFSASGTVLRIEMQNEELAPGSLLMYPDNDGTLLFNAHNALVDSADMPLSTIAAAIL